MTTASEGRWRAGATDGALASFKRTLDKPLTSYYLVLGVSALLLALGLLMVLSASSVTSLKDFGNSYAIFFRQAMWAAVGLPLAFIASRMSLKSIRFLAWPALLFSMALIVLTYIPGFGVAVSGNKNWVSLGGPIQLQPSEFAKLALVLWCADVYARKGKLLTQWRHLIVPMVPVSLLVTALVVGQRDLGTALVLFAIVLGLLWVVGAPARSVRRRRAGARGAGVRAGHHGARARRPADDVRQSPRRLPRSRAGRRATASSHSRRAASGGAGSGPAIRSGATSRALTPTTSSRSSAKSSACSAAWSCSGCS